MIADLGFRLEYRPHSDTCSVAWLVEASGRRRRATPEEEAMWKAIEELCRKLGEWPETEMVMEAVPPEPEKTRKRR